MNPLRKNGPVLQNDQMFNGWVSAVHGLIVMAQAGAGVRVVDRVAAIREPAGGARLATPERTAHGDLAPRG